MSMPNFPEGLLEITCDQALNLLLGSIAMEELGLSHIINAEGEKLQYILGTLPNRPCTCSTPHEILEVNRSVTDLLERVSYTQLLLKGKLQQVLDAKLLCCPPSPHPPCPPAPICTLVGGPCRTWAPGHALPWRSVCGKEGAHCWQGCSPTLIHFSPQKTYLASLSLRLRTDQAASARLVQSETCGTTRTLWITEGRPDGEGFLHLSGCTVLAPVGSTPSPSPIQLILQSTGSVTVERAILHLNVIQ